MEAKTQPARSSSTKGGTVLVAIFFTLALIITLLAISFNRTLLSDDYVKSVLEKQKVYEQVPAILADTTLPDTESQQVPQKLFGVMTRQQITALYQAALPENYVQTQVEQALDSLYNFINLKTYALNLQIDLAPLKQNLQGQAGTLVLDQLIAALPECNADQLVVFSQWLSSQTTVDFSAAPICKPTGPLLSLITPVLNAFLQQYYQSLPDTLSIFNGQNTAIISSQVTQSQGYKMFFVIRRVLLFIPWAALVLGLLLIALNLHSLKRMASSLGISALVAGGLDILLFLIVKGVGQTFLMNRVLSSPATTLNMLINSSALALLHQLAWVGCIVGAFAAVVGLLLTVFSTQMKKVN